MSFLMTIRLAYHALLLNKLRSALALLGIAVGVAAVVTLMALGVGFQREIERQFESVGSNVLMVFPDIFSEAGQEIKYLTERDYRDLQNSITAGEDIVPFIFLGREEATTQGKHTAPFIVGTGPEFARVQLLACGKGRFFEPEDVIMRRHVCVLDWKTAEKLFGKQDPVGQKIRLFGGPYQVIGVLLPKASTMSLGPFSDKGMNIYLPVTTLQQEMNFREYHGFYILPADVKAMDSYQKKVQTFLQQRYGKKHSFRVFSTKEFSQVMMTITATITGVLGAIGGIALLIGGIGIVNIMMVTVVERTYEIGIRRAVGASAGNILLQFFSEALILCMCGGLGGVLFGYAMAEIIGHTTPMKPVVSFWVAAIAFIFSGMVGMVFGVFPALRAAQMHPVEALRFAQGGR